jgi:phosphate transport system permease protein
MAFAPRPSVQPWRRANNKRIWQIVLASVAPLALTLLFAASFGIDSAVATLLVFLPLQLASAGFVGFRAYGRRGLGDAFLVVVTIFLSVFVLTMLLSVLFSVLTEGAKALSWQFFSQNNVYVSGTTSLEFGGVGHAIIGSLLVVGITTLVAVPLGISMAVFLTQSQSKLRNLVRTFTQALSGLPSVVSGLFILSIITSGDFLTKSGISASMALIPLMLPTVARVAEEALKLVPADLRYAALALGAPNYRAFFQVILPAAKSGLITALLLGLARVIGETAPLLLTLNTNNGTSLNPVSGGLSTLPTFIYSYLSSPFVPAQQRAWGGAIVLLLLVAVLFGLARILGRTKSLKTKPTNKKASK